MVKPLEGLSAEIAKDGQVFPFKPTVYDPDWDTLFGFTRPCLIKRGLEKDPFPHIESGWINIPNIENPASAQIIQMNGEREHVFYKFDDREIVIIKSGSSGLTIRDIQPIDIGSKSEDLPQLTKFKKEFVPLNKLYDDSCNLRITILNTRGC